MIINANLSISSSLGFEVESEEQSALELFSELRDQDFALSLTPISQIAVIGTKDAPSLFTGGQLLLTLASSSVLSGLIGAIQAWVLRNNTKEVSIEINGDKLTIKGSTDAEREKLISMYLEKHTK